MNKTVTVADKAIVGVSVTFMAQGFDDLKRKAESGYQFTNEELVDLFAKAQNFLDDLTEFFVTMVKEESP